MKRASLLGLAMKLLAASTMLVADLADAKRMGGGRTFGAQRQAAPPAGSPSATPAAPAAAAPMQSAAAKAGAPAAASGASRWLGPVAGLAAGLGLAALMSHLGLSEAFGSFLLIALVIIGGVFLLRLLLARKNPPARPLQYAGAGAGLGSTPGGYETQVPPGVRRWRSHVRAGFRNRRHCADSCQRRSSCGFRSGALRPAGQGAVPQAPGRV